MTRVQILAIAAIAIPLVGSIPEWLGVLPQYVPSITTIFNSDENKARDLLKESKDFAQEAQEKLENEKNEGTQYLSTFEQAIQKYKMALDKLEYLISLYPLTSVIKEAKILLKTYNDKMESIKKDKEKIQEKCPNSLGMGKLHCL